MWIDKHRDKWTCVCINRQIDGLTGKQTSYKMDICTNVQTDKQTDRKTDWYAKWMISKATTSIRSTNPRRRLSLYLRWWSHESCRHQMVFLIWLGLASRATDLHSLSETSLPEEPVPLPPLLEVSLLCWQKQFGWCYCMPALFIVQPNWVEAVFKTCTSEEGIKYRAVT